MIEKLRDLNPEKFSRDDDKECIAGALGCAVHVIPTAIELVRLWSRSDDPWKRETALRAYRIALAVERRDGTIGVVVLPYPEIQAECRALLSDSNADVNALATEIFFDIQSQLSKPLADQQIETDRIFKMEVVPLAHGRRWAYVVKAAREHLILDEQRGLKAAHLCLQYDDGFLRSEVLEWFIETLKQNPESFLAAPCEELFRELLRQDKTSIARLDHYTRGTLFRLLQNWTANGIGGGLAPMS